jgi:hypothetical protein
MALAARFRCWDPPLSSEARQGEDGCPGHASISITLDRYGHLLPGSEAEALAKIERYHTLSGGTDSG